MDSTADIHLSLPQELLSSFDRVADERGLRRVALLRIVLEDFVKQVEARRIGREIGEYVDQLGTASGGVRSGDGESHGGAAAAGNRVVRGEIYFMDLAPRSGSEQLGRRPCIVVSHDGFSADPRWQSVTVVPLTSAARWQRSSPTAVLFQAGACNLPRASAAIAHQTTLDKNKIIAPPVGRLTSDKLAELDGAQELFAALGGGKLPATRSHLRKAGEEIAD